MRRHLLMNSLEIPSSMPILDLEVTNENDHGCPFSVFYLVAYECLLVGSNRLWHARPSLVG
jgi:hypothetical protein